MHSSALIRLLEHEGWRLVRSKGSHLTYKHPSRVQIVTVPHPKKDLPTGTVRSIMRTARLI
ncbi:type II toxin-antitoxin system HicA family toxin [Cupriavidus pauculus]|uniref:Addiction module toxin, HicA family n=1 Tax=Cupriavidus pauculus TaxID=82633 RepID=A0A2N5CCP5_9BURK|nr:type II toxin-antitoxin system HicA family toxin [Cupriavidus pauculus]PLP99993.1 addiction module toxin, HicA family [Cupriavidus pauculus]